MDEAAYPSSAPHYDSEIDTKAADLKFDFSRFVGAMRESAGKPEGYYKANASSYVNFLTQLAAIKGRSERFPNQPKCSFPTEISNDRMENLGPSGNASCVTIMIHLVQEQLERLRMQHELRCAERAAPGACATLFPKTLSPLDLYYLKDTTEPDSTKTFESKAPFVEALFISLNELIAAERDLKPNN